MVGILKSRKVLFGALTLLVAGATATYFLYFKSDSPSEVLKSGAIQSDLAKGECSSETTARLEVSSKSSDASERAKLYENQGLCFVYGGDFTNARKAYKLSQEAYVKAGLEEDAARLGRAIEGVSVASMPRSDVLPANDAEFVGGN